MTRRVPVAGLLALLASAVVAAPSAAADTRVVETGKASDRPCQPVVTATSFVRGGCRAQAYLFDAELTVRTLFGGMRFGKCIVSFDMTLSGNGRVWLDDVRVGGTSPCNDVWACSPPQAPGWDDDVHFDPPFHTRRPWAGRVESGGADQARLTVKACLDTCLGRYAGPLDLKLERDGGKWTLVADDAGFGMSGLALDGRWSLDRSDFSFR